MYGKYHKFKTKRGNTLESVIQIFEKESPNVHAVNALMKFFRKMIWIGIVYFIIICFLQRYTIITTIFIIFATLIVCLYTLDETGKISYQYSKKYGGKKVNCFKKNKTQGSFLKNVSIMKQQEYKLLKKILKINNLYSTSAIQEIRNYLISKKSRQDTDIGSFAKMIITAYIIPITFGIISIYTSVNLKLGTEQDLINIGYIFFIALIVFSILLILYLIIKIKNFSITKSYTNNRLKVLLTEILIEKEQRKQEWLKKKKRNNIHI